MPVAIVYQPTPVFGGKAWSIPFLPVAPVLHQLLVRRHGAGLGVLLHQIGSHPVGREQYDLLDWSEITWFLGACCTGTERQHHYDRRSAHKCKRRPTKAHCHALLLVRIPPYEGIASPLAGTLQLPCRQHKQRRSAWKQEAEQRPPRAAAGRAPRLPPRRPPPSRSSSLRAGDAQQAELAAVALVREGVGSLDAGLLVDHERSRLDVDRGTRPARRRSTRPRFRSTPRRPRLPLAGFASLSSGPSSADWLTFAATRFVPVARSYCHSRAVVASVGRRPSGGNCWLEPGSSVIRRLFARRLDVVRLVDLVHALDRGVVALDQDRERRHLRRVVLVEHELPDAAVRRARTRLPPAPVACRVRCRRRRRRSACPAACRRRCPRPATNWKTFCAWVSPQCSSTHCGPSMPSARPRVALPVPSFGGAG